MNYEPSCKNCDCTEELFILPCKHVLCKNCIYKHNKLDVTCGYCGYKCNKQHVIEYNDDYSSDEYSEY